MYRVFYILSNMHSWVDAEKDNFCLRDSRGYAMVKALSSICRGWRQLVLPYRFKRMHFIYNGRIGESMVEPYISIGHSDIVRELEINIGGYHYIDKIDLAEIMAMAGIGQVVWPQLTKIEIVRYSERYNVSYPDRLSAPDMAHKT
ncbi:hypothetical protein GGI12_005786, partial [Dipsacomyces acuminosporus]